MTTVSTNARPHDPLSDEDGPLPPLCQLLGVLPLDSRDLLPSAFLPLTQPATDTSEPGVLAPYFPAYEDVAVSSLRSLVPWCS